MNYAHAETFSGDNGVFRVFVLFERRNQGLNLVLRLISTLLKRFNFSPGTLEGIACNTHSVFVSPVIHSDVTHNCNELVFSLTFILL